MKNKIDYYYHAWTVGGLTDRHTDADLCKEWLQDEDIWSDKDRKFLGKMTDEELTIFAKNIATMAKENLDKEINLIGKVVFDSYVDLATGNSADGTGYMITNEPTVADVYVVIAKEYMDRLQGDDFRVMDHGVQCEITECLYYIKWREEYEDNTVDHKELLGLYTDLNNEMVLIPYSHDLVEAARYIRHGNTTARQIATNNDQYDKHAEPQGKGETK